MFFYKDLYETKVRGSFNVDRTSSRAGRSIIKMALALFFCLVLINSVIAKQKDNSWYDYDKIVILKGMLIEGHNYGPPNYGQNPETDSRITYYLMRLGKPINVRGNPSDDLNTDTIKGVNKIQLEILPPSTIIKNMIGKQVSVKGILRQEVWGHDYTKVIIMVEGIENVQLCEQQKPTNVTISRDEATNKCFEELTKLGYKSSEIASMDIPKSCYTVDSLVNNDFYFSQNYSPRSERDQEVLAKLNNGLFWSCTFIPKGYIGLTIKIFIDSYSGDVITSMAIK